MNKFWDTFSKLAANVWQIADDAWKALRWNVAAAAAFAIYDKSLDQRALILGLGLSLIAIGAMAAYLVRWHISGLIPKGARRSGHFDSCHCFLLFCRFNRLRYRGVVYSG